MSQFKDCVIPKNRPAGQWFSVFGFKVSQKLDLLEMSRHRHREVCCVVVGCVARGKRAEVSRHCLRKHRRTLDELVRYAKERKLWCEACA